jgi:negative regulator of sigma E activity
MRTPAPNDQRPKAADDLSAWLDGELDDERAAELEAELQRDPDLRAELDQLESVVRLVREAGPSQAPRGFAHRVMARIDQEEAKSTRSAWAWLRRPWGIPLEGWALGLAAALALLLLIPFHGGSKDESEPPTREVSPAALEMPQAPKVSAEEGAPEVIPGKVTVEPKPVAKGEAAPPAPVAGTASEEAPAPTTEAPPEAGSPEGTAAPIPERQAPVRLTVRSSDPKTKLKIVQLAARYGPQAAEDQAGVPITNAAMVSEGGALYVTLPQPELPGFYREMERQGWSVTNLPTGEILSGSSVTVRVDVELAAPGTAEPAQADEAR